MELQGRYAITEDARTVGELEVSCRGAYFRFRGLCTSRRRGLLRLAVLCGGREIPLGVLSPSGSGWLLDRCFSPESLRHMGISRVEGCCILGSAAPLWRPEEAPERLLKDAALQQLFRGVQGILCCAEGERVRLAVPLEDGAAFPAMSVFCFMEAEEIAGKTYGVFLLEQGKLCMKAP